MLAKKDVSRRHRAARSAAAEVIAVVLPFQHGAHLHGRHAVLFGHVVYLPAEGGLHLLLGNAAQGIKLPAHTDVLGLVETAENAHLREFGHTGEQHKAQVGVGSLERRVEALEDVAVVILYEQLVAIVVAHRGTGVEYIEQWLVVLVDKHHAALAGGTVDKSEQLGKALTAVIVGIALVAILYRLCMAILHKYTAVCRKYS